MEYAVDRPLGDVDLLDTEVGDRFVLVHEHAVAQLEGEGRELPVPAGVARPRVPHDLEEEQCQCDSGHEPGEPAQQQEARLAREKLEAEISREEERKELVERQTTNQLKQAEATAKAERLQLEPYAELSGQSLVGLALRQFAEHPQSIGQLNITPDLLSQLSTWMTRKPIGNADAA